MAEGFGAGEWDAVRDEHDSQTDVDLEFAPNPGGIPMDVCYDTAQGEVCVKTGDQILKRRRGCASGTTPFLYSVNVTVQEYEFVDYEGPNSGLDLVSEVGFWVGINPTTGCLWVGNTSTGACVQLECDMPAKRQQVESDPAPFVDAVQETGEWAEENPEIVVAGTVLTAGVGAYVVLGTSGSTAALIAALA